jgi:protease I
MGGIIAGAGAASKRRCRNHGGAAVSNGLRLPTHARIGRAYCFTEVNAMEKSLQGCKVAVLVAEGFEQVEMTEPKKALEQAGAQARIVSPAKGKVQGWNHFDKGEQFTVDVPLDQANAGDFDALLLPGGVANPDQLRMNPKAVTFVKQFCDAGKPVAVICHGPWTLVEADVVRGRMITSWPSLKTDLRNAGANWVDREVVADHGLVSSRKPADIPAFNAKMIEEFAEARQRAAAAAR